MGLGNLFKAVAFSTVATFGLMLVVKILFPIIDSYAISGTDTLSTTNPYGYLIIKVIVYAIGLTCMIVIPILILTGQSIFPDSNEGEA